MKRKSLLKWIGFLGAVLAWLGKQFGLTIDPAVVMAALASIVVYVGGEAALDAKRFEAQIGRFKDPKFIIAFLTMLFAVIQQSFGIELPAETIIMIVTFVLGLLFGKDLIKAD